jgi:DNA-binding YbaB/EbfC family protein
MQAKLQAEVDAIEIEAAAGGGMVVAKMNGKKELVALRIQPDAITPDDPELLQDLVLAAVNEAGRKVEEKIQQVTQGMAGGLGMPPGFPGLG